MRKLAWPLHLTIAAAAVASMATSEPYTGWGERRVFQGPHVRLDETRATDAATFTLRASRKQNSFIEVVGLVSYELGAPQDLRLALVTPDQGVLVEQTHTLEGAGRLGFELVRFERFACEPGAEACEQTWTVELDAGSVPSGAIDIEWYVDVSTSGDGAEPPEDLVFDLDFERGQPVTELPELTVAEPPIDVIGDDRWLVSSFASVPLLFLDTFTRRATQRFSVRGVALSSGALFMSAGLGTGQPDPVELRLVVTAEEPATGVVTEQIVTVSGESDATFELELPQALDCPDGACSRDFTIVFETEDELTLPVIANIQLHAILEGEGDEPPPDVELGLALESPGTR